MSEQRIRELKSELEEKDELLSNTFNQLKQLKTTLRNNNEEIESLMKDRDYWKTQACSNIEDLENLVKNSQYYTDLLDKYNALRDLAGINNIRAKETSGCAECEVLLLEIEKLKKVVQEKEKENLLVSEIPNLENEVALLREDRGYLIEEINELKEKLAKNNNNNNNNINSSESDSSITSNSGKSQTDSDSEEEGLTKGEKEIPISFLSQSQTVKFDKQLQKIFAPRLPKEETTITWFMCYDSDLHRGYWYLTQNYLCFGASVFTRKNIFINSQKYVIKYLDIHSLNEVRTSKLKILGRKAGTSVILKLTTGQEILFRGFTSRDDAIKAVVERAKACGVNIEVNRLTKS